MTQKVKVLASLLGAASLLGGGTAAAQSILLPESPERGFWVEAAHPDIQTIEFTGATSVWFVSGRLPVAERVNVIADVPFTHARMQGASAELFGTESNQVLGNPLLGVEYLVSPAMRVEFSTRAPLTTADDESFADVVGALGDPHRSEAYMIDVVPLSASLEYRRALDGGLGLRVRGGPTMLFNTSDVAGQSESETMLDYGVLGSYATGPARVGLGVSGRWAATADAGSFSDNSLHQVGVSADMLLRGVRPGISLRVPLDEEYREVVKSSLGVYLQVPVR